MYEQAILREYLNYVVSGLPKKQAYEKLIKIYQSMGDESLRGHVRTEIGERLLEFVNERAMKNWNRERLEKYNIPVDEAVSESLVKILGKKLDTIKNGSSLEEYVASVVDECTLNVMAKSLYPLVIRDDDLMNENILKKLERLTYNGKGKELILEKGHSRKRVF